VIVTADHGNCELMWDFARNCPHTAHTTSLVPCWIVPAGKLRDGGSLEDVAPTVCERLGVIVSPNWTGRTLISA
jgi:2,3-bisphosphoglycerate-independent phosphoglycerate mutase